ncbi:hypothetical protein C8Q76DRAFT_700993 [Earliella scabrosa]|nr:hypothetical protein C8Q76DRAFT_700993 [Earliella scabrosa]
MSGIAQYKVATRPSPDTINAFATRLLNYLNICTEDGFVTNRDPVTRDRVISTMREGDETTGSFSARSAVPTGEDPDAYVEYMDSIIATVSSKDTLSTEDRVQRMHAAFSAHMVFQEYKVRLAYIDQRDVFMKITQRADDLPTAAVGTPAASNASESRTAISTPPQILAPSRPRPSSKLAASVIDDFLRSPSRMFDVVFKTEGDEVEWELTSFTQDKAGIQYTIKFAALPDRIPMDADAMRSMLQDSRLVTE